MESGLHGAGGKHCPAEKNTAVNEHQVTGMLDRRQLRLTEQGAPRVARRVRALAAKRRRRRLRGCLSCYVLFFICDMRRSAGRRCSSSFDEARRWVLVRPDPASHVPVAGLDPQTLPRVSKVIDKPW